MPCRTSALLPLAALCLALLPFGAALAQIPPLESSVAGPSFHALDVDHDGRVTLAEVLAYAKGQSAAIHPFRIAAVDADHDGVITPEEFRKAGISGFEGLGSVRARDLDISGDGYVSRQDLDEFFARKHRQAFARADADGDGSLRRSEFVLFRFK
ncbi:MAG: hypothetical protein AUJ49_11995 [Desulfovibrionaceae bacterium CG1_02_65_16]|nr:MAG: hypothetical protein AUJ49_11995 [Desulfovibrionaceae bacterium CG1_02_65_16]